MDFLFFFTGGVEKFLGGVQVMQYATLDASGGTSNGKPKCARG